MACGRRTCPGPRASLAARAVCWPNGDAGQSCAAVSNRRSPLFVDIAPDIFFPCSLLSFYRIRNSFRRGSFGSSGSTSEGPVSARQDVAFSVFFFPLFSSPARLFPPCCFDCRLSATTSAPFSSPLFSSRARATLAQQLNCPRCRTQPQPRSLRFTFGMNNTSSKSPKDIVKEIKRVLDLNSISYVHQDMPFLLLCTHGDIQFEMEVRTMEGSTASHVFFLACALCPSPFAEPSPSSRRPPRRIASRCASCRACPSTACATSASAALH